MIGDIICIAYQGNSIGSVCVNYEQIDDKEKELNQKLDLDKERKDRSLEEMSEEAEEYRKLFL